MSQGKPDDIPQDVWDAARSTYEELFRIGAFRGAGVVVDPQATIARAIMAERERCAGKWLPIESAPDQKWILGWLEDHGCVVVKRVEPNGRGGEHGDFVWATPESPDAGFWAEQLVTHYQLLPSGPTPPNGDVRG